MLCSWQTGANTVVKHGWSSAMKLPRFHLLPFLFAYAIFIVRHLESYVGIAMGTNVSHKEKS
jgi:hypothetical protein